MQPKVSIVGAGPAGFALAADLEYHGTSVLIYSHPTHARHAEHVINNGYLKANGAIRCNTNPLITFDMNDAVDFSHTIILTVPSTGQETVLQEMKKFDLRRHTIVAIPGNLFSLIAAAELDVENILETNLSPYSCRMAEGELDVSGKKSLFYIAPLRRDLSAESMDRLQSIFPIKLKWCVNIVEVCLANVNGAFHPLMVLMNAGRIESTAGDFFLYRDGLTRSTANAILALDKVRMEIGKALGFHMKSAIGVSNDCYGQNFADLVDLAQNSKPHNRLKAPCDLEDRNISEDVQDLLVCWHGFAERLGIDASPIKAVIQLAEMATGVDYMITGRTLQKLHLEDTSQSELIKRFGLLPN